MHNIIPRFFFVIDSSDSNNFGFFTYPFFDIVFFFIEVLIIYETFGSLSVYTFELRTNAKAKCLLQSYVLIYVLNFRAWYTGSTESQFCLEIVWFE